MARGLVSTVLLALLSSRDVVGLDFDGCTSIGVSSGATLDGSAMTSHANDCVGCDFRVVYVPAKDHPEGALRPILEGTHSAYPRFVDPDRSKQYQPTAAVESSKVLGYIPQARHTYALWEATYGMLNEKGLAIGESTTAALLWGNETAGNPKEVKEFDPNDGALFCISNLIAIALERCDTARCAIQTMGDLGAKYGFYGEETGPGGAGEALTIADASGETWVFHILGGLPEHPGAQFAGHRGALWAAQRVPDGHVAVIANNFIIREVHVKDTENFMVHPGLLALTQEAGLWDGTGSFDFLKLLAPDMRTFSYSPGTQPIPLYTTLRMWSVFNQVAPSLGIEMTDACWEYPFSVPVDKKLSHLDVMDLFRTHYEGTPFDMRLGALAGPFSSPNRAEGGAGMGKVKGQTARGMSIHRTTYTQVGQTGIAQPKLWFAPDASASSVFVPFYATVLAEGEGQFDEKSYGEGSMQSLDFSAKVKPAWWAFDLTANWMDHSYQNMSETYVHPKVQSLQREVSDAALAAEARAAKAATTKAAALALGSEQSRIQRHVSEEWWNFAAMLIVRYNDYQFNFPEHAPQTIGTIGYPAWWLEMVGFSDRSFFPNWVTPSSALPSMLPEQTKAVALAALTPRAEALCAHHSEQPETKKPVGPSTAGWAALAMAAGFGVLASGVAAGYYAGRRAEAKAAGMQDSYVRIGA